MGTLVVFILGANWTASQTTGNASALVPEPTTLSLQTFRNLFHNLSNHTVLEARFQWWLQVSTLPTELPNPL